MEEFEKMKFEPINRDKALKIYWEGTQNKIIRLWVYLKRGLDQVNEFKYVAAAIISLYVILKITNPLWMIIVALACIPPLMLIGRWQIKKVGKVEEWIGTEHGSVLRYNNYNIQVRQLELLEKINKKLNKK